MGGSFDETLLCPGTGTLRSRVGRLTDFVGMPGRITGRGGEMYCWGIGWDDGGRGGSVDETLLCAGAGTLRSRVGGWLCFLMRRCCARGRGLSAEKRAYWPASFVCLRDALRVCYWMGGLGNGWII